MVKKEVPNWNTIRVRESTYREIEKALNYDEVKKEGVSSITQFVTNAITKQLKELQKTGFKSVIINNDVIEIFDANINDDGMLVRIHHIKNKLSCLECNSNDCPHINYIWSIDHIADKLEGKGLIRTKKICPKCGVISKQSEIDDVFGYRKNKDKLITQSHCKKCRSKK